MKASSLKGAMFALRSAMAEEWGVGLDSFCPRMMQGNPANSVLVERYLDFVEKEQAKSGVTTKRPVIMLLHKLQALSNALAAAAMDPSLSLAARLQLRQDRAWIIMAQLSSIRNMQIGDTRVANTAFTDVMRSGILLNYTWGKTLRDGSEQLVLLPACPGDIAVCPVAAITQYLALARFNGWDMAEGFLFSPIDPVSAARLPGPGLSAAMSVRFTAYLHRWHLFAGETMAGTRGGGAVEALTAGGVSEPEVQVRAGWSVKAGRKQLQRYTAADLIALAAGGVAIGTLSAEEYARVNAGPLRTGTDRALVSL